MQTIRGFWLHLSKWLMCVFYEAVNLTEDIITMANANCNIPLCEGTGRLSIFVYQDHLVHLGLVRVEIQIEEHDVVCG